MEIQKDIGAEAIEQMQEILVGVQNLKQKLAEKDKKIAELEAKLKENNIKWE